jgi:hypothetical protein
MKEMHWKRMKEMHWERMKPRLSENNLKAISDAANNPVVQQTAMNSLKEGNLTTVVTSISTVMGLNNNRTDLRSRRGDRGKEMRQRKGWDRKDDSRRHNFSGDQSTFLSVRPMNRILSK